MKREMIMARLQAAHEAGEAIIGAGAGNGLSAKFSEAGGVDFLVVYNSGKFRMAGRGSLAGMMPYGDANALVQQLGSEILPIVNRTPVIAGVCGTDPFRLMPQLVRDLRTQGFSGIVNFPSVGLIDGTFRQSLEETGMGFDKEIALIAVAHDEDMLTTPYVFNAEEACEMAKVGADVIIAHVGLTTSGSIGATSASTLESAISSVQNMCDAALHVNPEVLVLCHGGPIATVADVRQVLSQTEGVSGFVGASTIERLASEGAIQAAASELKAIKLTTETTGRRL